jgi:hypothetical protein
MQWIAEHSFDRVTMEQPEKHSLLDRSQPIVLVGNIKICKILAKLS